MFVVTSLRYSLCFLYRSRGVSWAIPWSIYIPITLGFGTAFLIQLVMRL